MSAASVIVLQPGDKLFTEGDPSGTLYLVKEGNLMVYRTKDDLEIPLEIFKPGEFIGTVSILSGTPRSASVRAVTHALLECYGQDSLEQTLAAFPTWTKAMLKDVVTRLKRINNAFVSSRCSEKELQKKVPTRHTIASQLMFLLAECVRAKAGGEILRVAFPIENFPKIASEILRHPEEILLPFLNNLLVKPLFTVNKDIKHGSILEEPNINTLTALAQFCDKVSRTGYSDFVPEEIAKSAEALTSYEPATQAISGAVWNDISAHIARVLDKKIDPALRTQLLKLQIINSGRPDSNDASTFQFNPELLRLRLCFEKITLSLNSLATELPPKTPSKV